VLDVVDSVKDLGVWISMISKCPTNMGRLPPQAIYKILGDILCGADGHLDALLVTPQQVNYTQNAF